MFGFDMVLPMNTGAEAVETAIKLSRKWAYEKKGVPEGQALVLSVAGNFHGRTIGVIRFVVKFGFQNHAATLIPRLQHEYRSGEPYWFRSLLARCWP
jgi:acetylornithine/succinyldiaminopimelate/putrescine aminotransferase